MSRSYAPLVLSLFTFSAACTTEAPLPQSRVAGGHCVTTVEITSAQAAEPTVMQLTGICSLNELDSSTMTATQLVYADGHFTNQSTYTAANGDRLLSEFSGHVIGQDASAYPVVTLSFEGSEAYGVFPWGTSTGRFVSATGSTTDVGSSTVNFATGKGTGQYATTGTITY